jgi:nucleotide-binding universal stress UspA family protein
MAVGQWVSVVLDCPDPAPLASFWARLVGGEVALSTDDFVVVKSGSVALATVRVPDYQPPTWPSADRPKQMHLDLAVDDLDEAQAQAIALGATAADDQPSPELWRVMLDPVGHPFCLSAQIGDFARMILG